MATNEILPFSGTDTGTNLLTQAEYLADAQRPIGNQPGIARSKLVNKAMKQSSLIAAAVAEFISENQASNVIDTLTPEEVKDMMSSALGSRYMTESFLQSGVGAIARSTLGKLQETCVSVKDFGAVGDGVASDSAAFNAAILAVFNAGGGVVEVPEGAYFQTATIIMRNLVHLRGAGNQSTKITRTGSYGDTISMNTGIGSMSGIWMEHSTMPGAGATSLSNRLTDGSAHIALTNTQDVELYDVVQFRMPYGVLCDGAINTRLRKVWSAGVWDRNVVNMQEGVADVAFIGSSQHCQLAKISECYFSGYTTEQKNITYDNGTETKTVSRYYNIGRKNNVFGVSIEDLDISSSYFGRSSESCVRLAPNGGVLLDVRIRGNLFDNAGGETHSQLLIDGVDPASTLLGLAVQNNTFNGEYDTVHAISVIPAIGATAPAVTNMTVSGNNFFAHVGAPMVLESVWNGLVGANTVSGYNSIQVSTTPSAAPNWTAAVSIGAGSKGVAVVGNTLGGGGDGFEGANYCYAGVVINPSSYNCHANQNLLTGIYDGANYTYGTQDSLTYIHTASTNYQMSSNDDVIVVQQASPAGAFVVGLPAKPANGRRVIVKDGLGTFAANNCVLEGFGPTIDGASSKTLNENFQHIELRAFAGNWFIVG